jgi:hypothetical protein
MKKLSEAGVDAAKFFGTRERVGTHDMDRAMGVYMGIFGNVLKVSVYLSMPTDAAGKPLDGSKSAYTLTFAKGQLPPVKYFWSITMYSIPQRLLVEKTRSSGTRSAVIRNLAKAQKPVDTSRRSTVTS